MLPAAHAGVTPGLGPAERVLKAAHEMVPVLRARQAACEALG
ncbi:MAG TPA: hypothetical protein VKV73_33325 [Chloroflexota bacterium]|nr:hypothetical protein [Chloroflexota bacterium]